MHERFVEITTAGGVMDAFITQPEENGPFPAVIVYMDIWGIRKELYDIARRVGMAGYACLVPDFYYRNGKRVHFDFAMSRIEPYQSTGSTVKNSARSSAAQAHQYNGE
jgi:carboxymethylenebutenolidase